MSDTVAEQPVENRSFFMSDSHGLISVPVENSATLTQLVPDLRSIPAPQKGEVLAKLGSGEVATVPSVNVAKLQELDHQMTPIAQGAKDGVILLAQSKVQSPTTSRAHYTFVPGVGLHPTALGVKAGLKPILV